jgi:hypothetical protein
MRVSDVAINVAHLADQLEARTARRERERVRTPNCTHITMERVHYDDDPCPVCGRVPALGFMYECRQDDDVEFSGSAVVDDDAADESTKSDLRRELEDIGLSESVIVTAEQGGYTDQQLEKLKILKEELKQTVADAMQKQQISRAVAKLAYCNKPSNHDGALNSSPALALVSRHCAPVSRPIADIHSLSVQAAVITPAMPADLTSKTASISPSTPSSRMSAKPSLTSM